MIESIYASQLVPGTSFWFSTVTYMPTRRKKLIRDYVSSLTFYISYYGATTLEQCINTGVFATVVSVGGLSSASQDIIRYAYDCRSEARSLKSDVSVNDILWGTMAYFEPVGPKLQLATFIIEKRKKLWAMQDST